jgi:hypothetical protein
MTDIAVLRRRETAGPQGFDSAQAFRILSSLSQPSRLAVFLQVVAAGPEGAPAPVLAGALHTTGSALTLHLRALEAAGLVEVRIRRQAKRSVAVVARLDRCAQLGRWFTEQCAQAGWSPP